VDGCIALKVVPDLARPEEPQRLPGPPPKTCVGRERDRDVDVEDPLAAPLVDVVGNLVEHEPDPAEKEKGGGRSERDAAVIP